MNYARNMTADEKQCLEFFRKFCKGASVFAGLMAELSEGDGGGDPTEAVKDSKADKPAQSPAAPTAPAPAETKAPAQAETEANAGGKQVTRTDVQRAMAAKIKELSARGTSPDVVGQLFPRFHGAACVSDLKAEDYPTFLEELAKL